MGSVRRGLERVLCRLRWRPHSQSAVQVRGPGQCIFDLLVLAPALRQVTPVGRRSWPSRLGVSMVVAESLLSRGLGIAVSCSLLEQTRPSLTLLQKLKRHDRRVAKRRRLPTSARHVAELRSVQLLRRSWAEPRMQRPRCMRSRSVPVCRPVGRTNLQRQQQAMCWSLRRQQPVLRDRRVEQSWPWHDRRLMLRSGQGP